MTGRDTDEGRQQTMRRTILVQLTSPGWMRVVSNDGDGGSTIIISSGLIDDFYERNTHGTANTADTAITANTVNTSNAAS
jgi:hypothetical protein